MNSVINIKIVDPNNKRTLEKALEDMVVQQLIRKEEEGEKKDNT